MCNNRLKFHHPFPEMMIILTNSHSGISKCIQKLLKLKNKNPPLIKQIFHMLFENRYEKQISSDAILTENFCFFEKCLIHFIHFTHYYIFIFFSGGGFIWFDSNLTDPPNISSCCCVPLPTDGGGEPSISSCFISTPPLAESGPDGAPPWPGSFLVCTFWGMFRAED